MRDTTRFVATGSAYDLPEPSFDADLALVGKGTPMGELLRRYWHPVYKSDKLADLPVKVKALGDEIILFRKPSGEVGAVYPRCIHRGTDLIWGKVTDKGIRCCYHGWTFETDGKCVSQPAEPNDGGKGKNAVRQPWYPAEERYGLIFVYMGPLDRKPPLPRYDVLENIPEGFEIYADDTSIPSAGAGYMPCNWLQHHENGMDPAHVPIVHEHQFPPILAKAEMINTFDKLPDRIRAHGIFKLGPTMMDFKVDMPIPTVRLIPDPRLMNQRPDGKCDNVAWTLPKDDTDTMTFTAIVKPMDYDPSDLEDLYDGKSWHDLDFEGHQRFPGDFEAQVGQGAITYHSEEHLVSSDKGVVLFRRMLQAAVKDVQEGRDPPLTFGHDEIFIETWAGVKMLENPDFVGNKEDESDDAAGSAQEPATAPASGIDGTWALVMSTPMGAQTVTVILSSTGGTLTGFMSGDDGDVAITDGKINGNALRWKAKVKRPMPLTLAYDVTIDGDALSGTFKPGMFPSGPVTGQRAD
ncbi:Rieske 2Fe-2S domain-containing protein [Novosphingobium sp.]|uniref:Rieske 2Fe-2S domain-containing protein n=1 Tax=Novosphingobium sp. TaxID=1874826 RepID=UPI00262D7136|nr:Rieske 2Fe-2S domain-containing protein [Novosphingobium sp.]